MSNTYFQFKKFRIEQDLCAMKVCTDSCILGAYANPEGAKKILDIGTGTGLLALMLAQKSSAIIDAVEIEENAFNQARENFSHSPWKDRLNIFHDTIQDFASKRFDKYDFIISNPPFFSNQLKSSQEKRNIALHSSSLTFKELIGAVLQLLSRNGKFTVLLPLYEFEILKQEVESFNLYTNKILKIKDKERLPVLRVVAEFSYQNSPLKESQLVIKNAEGNYSEEFQVLLKDYYLQL